MSILDFFRNVGRALKVVFGLVKKIVPEEQLVKGIELVRMAAVQFVDNHDRREWVVKQLLSLFPFLRESVARLIVELAVQAVKAEATKAARQAADAVS